MISGKRVMLSFLSVLFLSAFIHGQVPTGRIFGTVTDDAGNPLPGAAVEATSPKLVGKASTVTDMDGDYRLFALSPGIYRITYTLEGFKTVTRDGIIVEIEKSVKLDIRMALGSLEEEVTVVGKSPLIDVKSTSKGMIITREMFEVLPRGRNFDTLVTTVPGVANEPLLGGLSVDGASGSENMYYLDGTDIGNAYGGTRAQDAAFEFVDEVQIKASGYQAEYGGSMGGVVNVIARQGGNELHGELIGFYSGSRLSGKERDTLRLGLYDVSIAEHVNYQDLYGKDEIHRIEAGFSLGGYILRDRLWFFGSFLPVFEFTERHVQFEPSMIEGDYTRRDEDWNFQIKLTAQPFSIMRLGASIVNNFYKYRGALPAREGTGDPLDVWPDYGLSAPNWSASAHADFTFGNNLLLSLRGGSFYTNLTDQLVQPTEPRWFHHGTGNSIYPDIPAEYIRPRFWENMTGGALNVIEKQGFQKFYINSDLSYFMDFAGEHAWKLGIQWVRTNDEWQRGYKYPDYPNIVFFWGRPLILFGENLGRGEYGYYRVIGNEATGPRGFFFDVNSDRWSIYLQDSWTIQNKLTLNLGLRAESEYIPSYSSQPELKDIKPIDFKFGDKLAPRLGFVYDVLGDSSLKVFGSYGLYFDVMKLYTPLLSFGGQQIRAAFYTLDTYEWDKIGIGGYYPGDLLQITNDGYIESFDEVVDPDLMPMSQREISLGVEKMLGENLSATMRLVQKHLRVAIEDVGVIVPGVGRKYLLTNPGFGYSLHTTNGGKFDPKYPECPKAKREYWAVNFSLDKRLADNWLAGFSYTWSRLTGNYSGLSTSDTEGRRPNSALEFDNWHMLYDKNFDLIDGPLQTDRTHFFKLYGAYTLPWGLTVGTVINAMSGAPSTEVWLLLGTGIMPYNRANLGRHPFLWFANLYAEYGLKLGKTRLNFNINVDNLFDVATVTKYHQIRTLTQLQVTQDQALSKDWELETSRFVPDPRFKMADSFYPPLSARLGIKFIF